VQDFDFPLELSHLYMLFVWNQNFTFQSLLKAQNFVS